MATPAEIIAAAVAELRRAYVLAERVPAVEAALASRLAANAYDSLAGRELCEAITADLRSACPDPHLRLRWYGEANEPPADDQSSALAAYWQEAATENFGIHQVARLPGNIGYLDLRAIEEPDHTAPSLNAAMVLLAHTGALLLDLRHNRGGTASGAAYFCSFFFAAEPPVHLNDVYDRAHASTRQYWSAAFLPAPRYAGPVWVLIGSDTFSAGEEIAYNLQQYKRATLVGAPTRGGAHPIKEFRLTPHISIQVPNQRSINPISGTNWEGVGVIPDVAVEPDQARHVAYERALRAVLAQLGDDPAPTNRSWRDEAAAALADLA